MLRIGALKAGGIGLALLCGTMVFVGCGGDDGGDDGRSGGAGGQGGSGAGAGGTGTSGTGTAGTGTAGTGTAGTGTAGTGGTGGAATSACAAPVTPTTAGILDYESGYQDAGPTLGTYVYGDSSGATPGTITPTSATVASGVMAPGADGTANGFHFTGTGFAAASYGGGLGVWLNCRNASGATGITFWYQSDVDLKVTLEMPSNKPIDPDMGECAGDYATCVQPSTTIPAAASWTQTTVDFTEVMGGMPTATFDPTKLVGIGIAVVKPAAAADGWGWDISIDEVEFAGLPGGNGTGGAPGAGGAGGDGGGDGL